MNRHCYAADGKTTMRYWQGQFYRWNGTFYAAVGIEVMQGRVMEFLDGSLKWAGGQTVRFQPKQMHVNEVLFSLKSCLALDVQCQPPMWLDTGEPAKEMIVFRNGIVNVLTGEMAPLTHRLWTHSALGFDWNVAALCPTWDRFLEDLWPGDEESKQFIEEWMGYCMTEETKFHKGAMLIGLKRSGKGTITQVIRRLVGEASYVALSFDTWVSTENSRAPMIGKRVGVFADVRLKRGRAYGASYDPGGLSHVSSGLLLNITGGDPLTLGRKNIGAWEGRLPIKIMLLSNEVPNLNDVSGALPSRFIKLRFGVSFYGREDVNLLAKLERELSGIAARCISAYGRLVKRGWFIQPNSAEVLDRDVLIASDPLSGMAMECFIPDPEGTVVKTAAYFRFETWCRENKRGDLWVPDRKFGEMLAAIAGFERITTAPRQHGQGRSWLGIRLRPKGN